jgi:leucyl/phenylalanyl-tRNA--protein transferase
LIPKLTKYSYIFPDPNEATKEGLVAWGGDLNPDRIMSAYLQGIFPWFNEDDPILWWSPDPRLILYPKDIKISKSLKKSIKKYEVKINTNFEEVIKNCRDVRVKKGESSWIFDDIIDAYKKLYENGLVMSFETYYKDELVGGLYGVDLGDVFCGESMFSKRSDASKVALAALCEFCEKNGYRFIDCQIPTDHLKSMGAVEISREKFLSLLRQYTGYNYHDYTRDG